MSTTAPSGPVAALNAAAASFVARYQATKASLPGDSRLRAEAADLLTSNGLPGPREEAWRYTSLRPFAEVLRLSDIAAMAPAAGPHEEVVPCDLADKAAVHALVDGVERLIQLIAGDVGACGEHLGHAGAHVGPLGALALARSALGRGAAPVPPPSCGQSPPGLAW